MHGSETGDRKELSLCHRNTEPVSRVSPFLYDPSNPGFAENFVEKARDFRVRKSKQKSIQESGQEEVTLWRIPIAFLKIKTVSISLVIRA